MNLTTLMRIGDELTESSTFGDRAVVGLQVVAIGMGVVFGVLILLIGILQLFKLFGREKKSASVESVVTAETTATVKADSASSTSCYEERIVAIATSAIAASRGQSEVNFRVISIAPIGNNKVQNYAPVVSEPKVETAPSPAVAPAASATPTTSAPADGVKINAPLPGNVLDVKVSVGAAVKSGDVLCILEAMKMENEIVAPQDGTIATVAATKGSSVNTGDLLFVIG